MVSSSRSILGFVLKIAGRKSNAPWFESPAGEHAKRGAVRPVGLSDIHPHAHKPRLGKHRLKVLIKGGAHGQAYITLKLEHMGAIVRGRTNPAVAHPTLDHKQARNIISQIIRGDLTKIQPANEITRLFQRAGQPA